MIKRNAVTASRQAIPKIGFNNARVKTLGIEVITLEKLRKRAPETLNAPQRVDFFFLMMISAGQCRHTIDFVDFDLAPGSVVFLRPGQVQQWHLHDDMMGLIVLIADEAMNPTIGMDKYGLKLLSLDDWPSAASINLEVFKNLHDTTLRLQVEIANSSGSEREVAIIRYNTIALFLRLAIELQVGNVPAHKKRDSEIFHLFSKELEQNFQKHLRVAEYANRLGYSQSTLQRACLSSAQAGAKAIIDKRLALEAKRLLVHTDAAIVDIGYRLGFVEPSNFIKFFKRKSGSTPLHYRKNQQRNGQSEAKS